jgi:hypothetical protein
MCVCFLVGVVSVFCCLVNETLSTIKHAQCPIKVITEWNWNDADVIGHNLRETLMGNLPVEKEENDDEPPSLYKAFESKQ